jgi:hypothetical protein
MNAKRKNWTLMYACGRVCHVMEFTFKGAVKYHEVFYILPGNAKALFWKGNGLKPIHL